MSIQAEPRSAAIDGALSFARSERARFLAELGALVRIPSVSGDPRHAPDMRACADWLARHLEAIGFERTGVVATHKQPIVVAESRRNASAPTVLIYGHYDVLPADPLSAWHSPPFEPVVRGGALYGRGSCDDKGQLFAHVKALESWIAGGAGLPLNVVCAIEGDEELDSVGIRALLESTRALGADVAVISDTVMRGPRAPTLTYATRGQLAMEVEVRGPAHDLHSGLFGGAVHDPAQALAEVLATLHDAEHRVAADGFYADVRPLTAAERASMARNGPADDEILRAATVPQAWGDAGYTLYERTTARPSLTINGISGGYAGPGHKAIIPARATAKLSVRLVPDQQPQRVAKALNEHLRRVVLPTVRLRSRTTVAVPPARLTLPDGVLAAARDACRLAFGRPPAPVRLGGTVPVAATLQQLGIPTLLLGLAQPDDGMHGPDEHFALENFFRGIDMSIRLLGALAAPGAVPPMRNRS